MQIAMKGHPLDNSSLLEIVNKYNHPMHKLCYGGICKRSGNITKIHEGTLFLENFAVFDFYLSKEDMGRIDQLNQEHQVGPDTNNFDI